MSLKPRRTLLVNIDAIGERPLFCGESLIGLGNEELFGQLKRCFSLKIRFMDMNPIEYDYILVLTIARFPDLTKKGIKERTLHLLIDSSTRQCLRCGYKTTSHPEPKNCPKCNSTLYPYVLRKNDFFNENKMRKIIEATTTVDEIRIIGEMPKIRVLKKLFEAIPEYFDIKIITQDPLKHGIKVDVS